MEVGDLTAAQLRDLRDGEPLTFPPSERCPMAVGDVLVLETASGLAFTEEEIGAGVGVLAPTVETPVLWVEVYEIRRTRKLEWRVLHRRCDHRPLWMRSGPPKPEGSRLKQRTWTQIEEHGLTGRVANALDPSCEVESGRYANVIEMGARLKAAERQDAEAARRQARSIAETVKQIVTMAARSGIDVTPHLAQIQRALDAAQDEIDEAA